MKYAVSINNIHKTFKLATDSRKSIKSLFIKGRPNNKLVETLRNVSLNVEKGEFFGIIGRNGSGKSTLLKIIAQVYQPTKGSLIINGKLTPFIELGVGFNPELNAKDNVFLNGSLLGFSRKEMSEMYEDIVDFAELQDSMDKKLKNFSSGMQVRLDFSIAIRSKADIFIIDEVLAVVDFNFQKKCIEVFKTLKEQGKTIIFVSHSMEYVREFCDRVAVVDEGIVVHCGEVEKGIDLYNKINYEIALSENDFQKNIKLEETEHLGNGGAKILNFKVYDEKNAPKNLLTSGRKFRIEIEVIFNTTVKKASIGVMFRKDKNENLFGINNYYTNYKLPTYKEGDRAKFSIGGVMPLSEGDYYLSLSVADIVSRIDYTDLDILNNYTKIIVSGEPRWGLLDYAGEFRELDE